MTMSSSEDRFRSILPHEPLPEKESGYVLIQGSFECRKEDNNDDDKTITTEMDPEVEETILSFFSSPPYHAESMLILSPTKIRLIFSTPFQARSTASLMKESKITPHAILRHRFPSDSFKVSQRVILATLVTPTSLPSNPSICWRKTTPPKFFRLIPHNHDVEMIERQRNVSRFVFLTGFLAEGCREFPKMYLYDIVRQICNPFDSSSGLGVEVFFPNFNKRFGTTMYCYIGMRSHEDARRVILELQGKSVSVNLLNGEAMDTDRLYLDWADITKGSQKKTRQGDNNNNNGKAIRGQPTQSECTSTTEKIEVPGLVLIPDFLSKDEENSMMAVLTGPCAPWAPSQKRMSGDEHVKRRVQHYGYVFDYATADVLRDRNEDKGRCPPLPAVPLHCKGDVEAFVKDSVKDQKGWDVLAGVVERTRQAHFNIEDTNDGEDAISDVFAQINQITVNEYSPGQGIGSHTDTCQAFDDGIISISLNSGCVMEFKHTASKQRKLVYLPPRSLLLMSHEARYQWEHMIVNRKTDTVNGTVIPRTTRISLTLRTALSLTDPPKALRPIESSIFPPKWDTAVNLNIDANINDQQQLPISPSIIPPTPACEKNHVHAVYDAIATQWNHTRGKRNVLWPSATQFITSDLPPFSLIADVGCGDGKYFQAGKEAHQILIGLDISIPLLQTSLSSDKDAQAVGADCMNLPLVSDKFDAAICIAVMHHLSTVERRIHCIKELKRIVKKGGMFHVQAWAIEQQQNSKRNRFGDVDVFVPFKAQPRYLNKVVDGTSRECKDEERKASRSVAEMYSDAYEGAEFDESKGLVVFQRYCHMYRKGELEELAGKVPGLELVDGGYESGNWFVILRVND